MRARGVHPYTQRRIVMSKLKHFSCFFGINFTNEGERLTNVILSIIRYEIVHIICLVGDVTRQKNRVYVPQVPSSSRLCMLIPRYFKVCISSEALFITEGHSYRKGLHCSFSLIATLAEMSPWSTIARWGRLCMNFGCKYYLLRKNMRCFYKQAKNECLVLLSLTCSSSALLKTSLSQSISLR